MESFEEIYSLYFKDIYRYVLSLCRNSEQAEEITQETFFQAMKSISSFRVRLQNIFTLLKSERRNIVR